MDRRKLPNKRFRVGEVVEISKKCSKWVWYREGTFLVVSYYLYINDAQCKGGYEIHDKYVSEHILKDTEKPVRWLIKVKSTQSGKYYTYAESFINYDEIDLRNKRIDKLIEEL